MTTSYTDMRHQEITRQFAALGNPALVRITGTHATKDYAKNFCKDRATNVETFWTMQDVLDNGTVLAAHNAKGWNIFVTPIEEEGKQIHILIDDLRPEFFEAGFEPNLLQRSSPKSQQAVFVLPYQHPREIYLRAFNELNKAYGDPQISGLRHPFRLAGYTNRKPKHETAAGFPFIEIENTMPAGHVCPIMLAYVDALAADRQGPLGDTPATARPSGAQIQPEDAAMGRDYFMAQAMIRQGKTGTELLRCFEQKSEHLRDVEAGISGYDTDPERYVSRTLERASQVAKPLPAPRPSAYATNYFKKRHRPTASGPRP